MAVQSIINVDIDDDKLLKFVQLYKELQDKVKQMPAEWQAGAAAIADATEELDALTAAYAARTEMAKKNREEDKKEAAEKAAAREEAAVKAKEERELAKEEREAERAAAKEKAEADKEAFALERERQKAEEDHQKKIDEFWTKKRQQAHAFVKDFGLGLLGIGAGLFGLERLADAVSGQRVAAQGMGITTGEAKAFDVNFGTRLGLDSSFISHVQDVQADLSQRWQFVPLGLQHEAETEDHATLSADLIKRAKAMWDEAGPQGHNTQWMQAHGLSGFMNFSQWQTIGAQAPEQINQYAEQYVRDSKKLATDDPTQLAWQTLSEQLKRAGEQIENVFVRGLAPLALPIAHLSDSVGKAIDTFLKTAPLEKWINELGHGIEWLATYLGSKGFQDDITRFMKGAQDFFDEVVDFAKKLAPLLDQISAVLAALGFGPQRPPGEPDSPAAKIPVTRDDAIQWNKAHPDKQVPVPDTEPAPPSRPFQWWNPGSWLHHDAAAPDGLTPDEQKKLGLSGMDELLDAVKLIESGGRDDAVGPMTKYGTAKGGYQLIDATWAHYGHGGSPFDPVASRQAAREYLTDLEKKYEGDVPKALAAYNWGPGNLDKDIAVHGSDWLKYAPEATRKYVHDAAQKIHVKVTTMVANQTGAQVAMSANAVRE